MENTYENAYQFWNKHQSMNLTDLLVEYAKEVTNDELNPSGQQIWVDILEESNKGVMTLNELTLK